MSSTTVKPRLRHCTLLAQADDASPMRMIVGRDEFEIAAQVGSRNRLLEVKRYFDGRHSIDEISERTGVGLSDVTELVQQFKELGLLRTEAAVPEIETATFVSRVQDSCLMWGRQIGFHRLFGLLREGAVRPEHFLGLILETFHYVRSAPRHTATAIACCADSSWESLLTKYLIEEHDHAELILQTLENIGVRREDTLNAHPLIGTLSLVNMLCEIGRQSTLAYFACTNLFEARREDFEEGKASFEQTAQRYGWPAEAVAPIVSHLTGDVMAGHTSLLSEALAGRRTIPAAEAHVAINLLHDLKHSFDQFHDQILQYYSDVSNYIPRLKVDFFSL